MANSYADNVCAMLRRRGLAPKYEHPGIYCIKVAGQIVYIGKSENTIYFDVLYYAKAKRTAAIREEIGRKEGEYIRQYRPVLNTQIPKAEDWHKWETNMVDARAVLKDLL